MTDAARADGELSSALNRLLAISEAYPQLKANTNFIQLQDELAGTENRLAVARKDYNDAAQAYNAKLKSVPYCVRGPAHGIYGTELFQGRCPGPERTPGEVLTA